MKCLQLEFKCIKKIDHVLLYSGVQWYAGISHSIRPWLNNIQLNVLSESNIKILPVNKGIIEYFPGDKISLLMFFPEDISDNIQAWIQAVQSGEQVNYGKSGQFIINKTVELIKALDPNENLNNPTTKYNFPLDQNSLQKLTSSDEIRVIFISPLRLKRPDQDKEKGHKYYDSDYFNFNDFLRIIEIKSGQKLQSSTEYILSNKQFIWVDMAYKNSLGGIIGSLIIKGRFSEELIQLLVWGQTAGIGKNTSFGFGQYRISLKNDIFYDEFRSIKNLFLQMTTHSYLEEHLNDMDQESLDFDGINLNDVLLNKEDYINKLIEKLKNNTFIPSEFQTFHKKKKNGKYRTISVFNFTDRFVFKNLAKLLANSCDELMSSDSYAYRSGMGYHKAVQRVKELYDQGFRYGVKVDIESFFDSIPLKSIFLILEALFLFDPLLGILRKIFTEDQIGLNQGNALSPLLSNIYMIGFDQDLQKKPFRMVRFADDILILSKENNDQILQFVENVLIKYDLKLSIDKTVKVDPNIPFEFLGHLVQNGEARSIKCQENTDPTWTHLFDKNRLGGIPVYLSYYNSYARTEGETLVIEMDSEKRKIPWKEIQRLVIIGKPRVSASVIKKALEYQKGIIFSDILGNPKGAFHNIIKWINIKELVERRGNNYDHFVMNFIKTIVEAKIHNQKMMLQKREIKSELLQEILNSISNMDNIDSIRGKEGAASAEYFRHFRKLTTPFPFEKREYYPPVGPVNAMLSLGYTLLYNRLCEVLISKGYYPYEGVYHIVKGLHKALASDLMEPLRFIPERVILHLIHNHQILPEDFVDFSTHGGKCTRLNNEGFKKFLNRFEWSMNQVLKYHDKVMTHYGLLDETVSSLHNSIVLGVEYKTYRLR